MKIIIFFGKYLEHKEKGCTFAPANRTNGPFVYRLGREIFIL